MHGIRLGQNPLLDSVFRKYGRLIAYSKREVILQATREPQGLYRIQSGFVKSYDITPQGSCSLLFIYQAGEVFPMHKMDGLFYEAMTQVEVHAIPSETVTRLMKSDVALVGATAEQLMLLLHRYARRIKNLGYRTARERVMYRLLELVERFGLESGSGVVIGAPITHQDIADSVNVTRETASREMLALTQEGVIQQYNHIIIIKDIDRLGEIFD